MHIDKMRVVEMHMLRCIHSKTLKYRIPNKNISTQLIVVPIEKKMRKHTSWFEYVQRHLLYTIVKRYIRPFCQRIKR